MIDFGVCIFLARFKSSNAGSFFAASSQSSHALHRPTVIQSGGPTTTTPSSIFHRPRPHLCSSQARLSSQKSKKSSEVRVFSRRLFNFWFVSHDIMFTTKIFKMSSFFNFNFCQVRRIDPIGRPLMNLFPRRSAYVTNFLCVRFL